MEHVPERQIRPDGYGQSDYTFRLPNMRIPKPIMPGIRGWKTSDGWMVLRLHYSADPERATDEWITQQLVGYRGGKLGRDWMREMEVDFSSYAGEPVYAGFDAVRSVLPTNYNPHLPLWRGWDFGYRHPAVVWAQLWEDDTLCILHEMYPTLNRDAMAGISTPDLIRMVIEQTESLFPHAGKEATGIVEDFVDPAGNQTKETSDFSSIEHMHQFGIDPEWSVVGRKNRINYLRSYIEVPGKLRVNPHCGLTIKALSAAYRYPEERGGQVDRDMPDLSKRVQEEPYVHIMDALEYVAACRLEIAFDPSSLRTIEEERQDVGTLAEMYLRYSGHNDRTDRSASGGGEPGAESYETGVSELLGLEDIADLTAALAEW